MDQEGLARKMSVVRVGLWIMIGMNLIFTAAYGWQFAPHTGAIWYGRLFSLFVHVLFLDSATAIWLFAIDSSGTEGQRRLSLGMWSLGMVLSSIASVVFAYLAFGGVAVTAGQIEMIQKIGFYTMLVAAFAQFVAAYAYDRLSVETQLAKKKAGVRRIRNMSYVGWAAQLEIDSNNAQAELLKKYQGPLVEQRARLDTEQVLLGWGYDPEQVKRMLPALPDVVQPNEEEDIPLAIVKPSSPLKKPEPQKPALSSSLQVQMVPTVPQTSKNGTH